MADACIIYDRSCIDCGECERCDLDDMRICDNCGRCIEDPGDYRSVNVDEFRKKLDDTQKLPEREKDEEE